MAKVSRGIIIGVRRQSSEYVPPARPMPAPGARATHAALTIGARQPFRGRIPNEFYPTPPEAVRALLSVEQFEGDIWEPACGEGAISQVLAVAGHAIVSTDLNAYGFGESGVDFLRANTARAKHIVTNPPYGRGLADAFLVKALALTRQTGGKVAMLLNLDSLCHPMRTPLWRRHPPARIHAIDGVVCWPEHRYGPAPEVFKRHRYCWVVWDPSHRGPTRFGWLSAGEFRQ